jgi:acetyl esterase
MATSPDALDLPAVVRHRRGDMSPGTDVSWRAGSISAHGHDVPVRVLTPARPSGWLVWAHGGSWSHGSAEQWHRPCADLAARSSCVVVSVDYRLAPHHPYPAPVDDVLAALTWARQQMLHDGTTQALLSVGGDSAGGTLAASAALAWRDRGHPLAAQVLAYPPLDPSCDAASYATDGRFPDRGAMRSAWAAYLGSTSTGSSSSARYGSPLRAEALEGVAPAILAVGELDPVRDDVSAYAQRLGDAGVQVSHRRFPDTAHGAFLLADPSMRAWLAATLRNHLDHLIEPSTPALPEGPT